MEKMVLGLPTIEHLKVPPIFSSDRRERKEQE